MPKCSGILKDGGMSEGLEKEIESILLRVLMLLVRVSNIQYGSIEIFWHRNLYTET